MAIKIICFGVTEEPIREYIELYNNALDVKVRKIQRAKEAKIAIFDHPTLI